MGGEVKNWSSQDPKAPYNIIMKMRFAVIDDAAFLREMIKNALESEGAVCVGESADGLAINDLISRTLPDLIILDMVLPETNGIEIAKEIRAENSKIKILGCSTLDSVEIVNKAKDAGVNSYLVKPFSKNQLIEEVKKILDI